MSDNSEQLKQQAALDRYNKINEAIKQSLSSLANNNDEHLPKMLAFISEKAFNETYTIE